ncbi:MAG: hypothetical protein H6704_26695 [Myxococcales bacterium]|nr:hypothetical protein [Myxococcales bacterium]
MSGALLLAVALLLPGELTEALEQYDFGEFEAPVSGSTPCATPRASTPRRG